MKDQHSFIPVSVAYPRYPSSNWEHQPRLTTVFHAWMCGRFIEINSSLRRKYLHWTNQSFNFLEGSFSNWENVRAPIQFRREWYLKMLFYSRTGSHMNTTWVIRPIKWNKLKNFSASKLDSCPEVNSSCCHKSDA